MKSTVQNLIGTSQVIVDLKQEIDRVARSDAKVLISGESGSGKEVVARAIHAQSDRADRSFVPVNCAGIPETLLESELFGHMKGSFTGAFRDKPGKLELADSGTVFLDEIGEMTLRMQGLLLRFLETGELQKVGADRALGLVDVRVISATNRKLEDLIVQGQFRDDLFYRLNVIRFNVPPLRERKSDVPLLVDAALKHFTRSNGCVVREIGPEAMLALSEYSWPGNVRELQNVVERLVVTGRNEVAGVEDLPPELRNRPLSPRPRKERRRTVADELFRRIVDERESFWTAVYPLYMNREITKSNVRDLVGKGLEQARGNYKIVARLFNMDVCDYKKFLNFLRKHECQVPFREDPMTTLPRLGCVFAIALACSANAFAQQAPAAPAPAATTPAPVAAPQKGAVPALPEGIKPPEDYVIGTDDVLTVSFWREKDLSTDVVVRPDGKITLPLINDIYASGLTPDQLREKVLAEAARYIEDPSPTVVVKQINSRKAFIMGEVAKPGPYVLTAPTTVLQLIATAGGLQEFAKKKEIMILRMEHGKQITFTFDYASVVKRKKLEQNIFLKPGDTIVVP